MMKSMKYKCINQLIKILFDSQEFQSVTISPPKKKIKERVQFIHPSQTAMVIFRLWSEMTGHLQREGAIEAFFLTLHRNRTMANPHS